MGESRKDALRFDPGGPGLKVEFYGTKVTYKGHVLPVQADSCNIIGVVWRRLCFVRAQMGNVSKDVPIAYNQTVLRGHQIWKQ